MNITLESDLESFVQERVRAGQFSSANAVVAAALRLLQDDIDEASGTLTPAQVAFIKREAAIGIDELDRGESAPLDIPGTIERCRAQWAERQGNAAR